MAGTRSSTPGLPVTHHRLCLLLPLQRRPSLWLQSDAEIADTASEIYFLVVDMDPAAESYASTNSISDFRFTFDPDADSLNEDDTEDSSVSVADSTETQAPVAIPEFPTLAVPVAVLCGIVGLTRYRRRCHRRRRRRD